MSMVNIIGVDFSGAQSDKNTWITEGWLSDSILYIQCCRSIKRKELTEKLAKGKFAVAALDFPFAVPIAFAQYWCGDTQEMPGLWKAACELDNPRCFRSMVDRFAPDVSDEVLRIGDMHVPGCYSCLHRAQPNMVPMTFEGMKLLHCLWETGRFHVPPLPSRKAEGPVLLEVMPGAALAAFDLPDKGYKRGAKATQLRKEILSNLSRKSGISLPNLNDCRLNDYRERCLKYDDCLDSVVAAVVAALWERDKSAFLKPSNKTVGEVSRPNSKRWASQQALGLQENEAARREGWIYVPKPQGNRS